MTADVNVILSEETYGEDELLDELPGNDLENWQVGGVSKIRRASNVPPGTK